MRMLWALVEQSQDGCEDFGMEVWWKASEIFKWWDVERSSTKRSDFFGKSTKECSARSWKQSAWSSTELRNIGHRRSNLQELVKKRYSSMRLLSEDSTEQPLMWMMVSEIELLYAESIQVLVRTLIPESLLRLNKEQILDQCFKFILTKSWHKWNWNSGTFHDFIQENFMGSHLSRTEPQREIVTSCRARTQSHQ